MAEIPLTPEDEAILQRSDVSVLLWNQGGDTSSYLYMLAAMEDGRRMVLEDMIQDRLNLGETRAEAVEYVHG